MNIWVAAIFAILAILPLVTIIKLLSDGNVEAKLVASAAILISAFLFSLGGLVVSFGWWYWNAVAVIAIIILLVVNFFSGIIVYSNIRHDTNKTD